MWYYDFYISVLKYFNTNLLNLLTIFFIVISSCNPDKCEDVKDDCELESYNYAPTEYEFSSPVYFPKPTIQADNPLTEEGVALGRFLFYDPILSKDSTMSCAHCHNPKLSFTDTLAVSKGVDGIAGKRSSMSLINLAYTPNSLFWDGRSKSLESQVTIPIEDPLELHASWGEIIPKLQASDFYKEKFRNAFNITSCEDIDKELVSKAIAQFEVILISKNSKFDLVKKGAAFFTDQEARGFDMFFDISPEVKDAECGHCHNEPLFASMNFFNNGIDSVFSLGDFVDLGRGVITGFEVDNGKFRAPTLRNIMLTAPYMHDGRFQTIREVINHYSSGGKYAPNKDPLIYPTNFTESEIEDLVSFLETLTDTVFINNEAFSNPWE